MTPSTHPIAASLIYTGFRTSLDQLSNRLFGIKVDHASLACYSITASIATSIAMRALTYSTGIFDKEGLLWQFTTSSNEKYTKVPLTLLYLACVLGITLTSRTVGNLSGKCLTCVATKKPISSRQIEQLNVSTIGIGISALATTITCATNFFLAFQLKKTLLGE